MSRDHEPLGLAFHYRLDQFLRLSRVIDLDLFFTPCRKRSKRVACAFKVSRIKSARFIFSDRFHQPLGTLFSLRRKLRVLTVIGLLGVAYKENGLFLGGRIYSENTNEKKKGDNDFHKNVCRTKRDVKL